MTEILFKQSRLSYLKYKEVWEKMMEISSRNLFRLSKNSVTQSKACAIWKRNTGTWERHETRIKMVETDKWNFLGLIDLVGLLKFCLEPLTVKNKWVPGTSLENFYWKPWTVLYCFCQKKILLLVSSIHSQNKGGRRELGGMKLG